MNQTPSSMNPSDIVNDPEHRHQLLGHIDVDEGSFLHIAVAPAAVPLAHVLLSGA